MTPIWQPRVGWRFNDKKILGWVAEGQTVHEITKKGGCF